MFGDALLAADGYLGLSSRVDDPGRYVHLTDTILHQIRQSTNEVGPYGPISGPGALYIDVITYRNLQLPGHCSVEWIRVRPLLVRWDMGAQIPEATQRLERLCHPAYHFNHRQ
jgi:hypothetical protein